MWPTFSNLRFRARVNGAHFSTRFDRTPAALLWAALLYVTGRSIISFTEVANNKRLAVLRTLKGWEVVHFRGVDGVAECAIAYRTSRWRLIRAGTFKVADTVPLFIGHVRTLDALFEHWRTGQTLMWSVVHTPARVDGGDHWSQRSPRDLAAYKEMLPGWLHNLRNYQNDKDIDHVVAGGDMNLNIHEPVWRKLLWGTFSKAGLTSIWSGRMPKGGSHQNGNRLIDDLYTDLLILASGVGLLQRGSDHKMIWFRGLMHKITMPAAQWKKIVADRHRRWGK